VGATKLDILLKISLVIISGLLFARIAGLLNLPSVTGYLVGGLLIGPSVFNVVNDIDINNFTIINDIALCLIAFGIGSEFEFKSIKKLGKNVFIITFWQAFLAIVFVTFTMYFILGQSFALSILLGTISAATAPAATVLVLKQYKAKGPLTDTIVPVVAIDDAICIMAFGIGIAIAKMLVSGGGDVNVLSLLLMPIYEILGSLALGAVLGLILWYAQGKTKSQNEMLCLVLGMVFLGGGLAQMLHLSTLLTGMMMGAILVNLVHNNRRIFSITDSFSYPIYLYFFTLAGASLHMDVVFKVGMLGVGYIIARAAGKIIGAALGSKLVQAPEVITKYLGLALLPQAGVAIGLSLVVKQTLPELGTTITTIILAGVMFYEIIGPITAKIAIDKAGEIGKLQQEY